MFYIGKEKKDDEDYKGSGFDDFKTGFLKEVHSKIKENIKNQYEQLRSIAQVIVKSLKKLENRDKKELKKN